MGKFKKSGILMSVFAMLVGAALFITSLIISGGDWMQLDTTELDTYETKVNDEFESIEIKSSGFDVTIIGSDDEKALVSYPAGKGIVTEVYVETDAVSGENRLVVITTDTRKWYETAGVHLKMEADDIVVMLPMKIYKSLDVSTASGEISVHSQLAFENVVLSTASGDINCNANVRGELSALTTSGEIYLGGQRCTALSANSVSGEIDITDVIASKSAALETVSGEIDIYRFDAPNIELSSVSGSIDAVLLSGKRFNASTMSGSIDIPRDTPDGGICSVGTVSGDVEIEIEH